MKNTLILFFLFTSFTQVFFFPHNSHALFGMFEGKYQKVTQADGVVTIPLTTVNDGKAHYYSYKDQGRDINFFVVKSNDGTIRAAFDACDVCFPEKKGYSQQGDYMVCNNCGQKFHSTRINVVKGGCNPAPLTREIVGEKLLITVSDIRSGSRYF